MNTQIGVERRISDGSKKLARMYVRLPDNRVLLEGSVVYSMLNKLIYTKYYSGGKFDNML